MRASSFAFVTGSAIPATALAYGGPGGADVTRPTGFGLRVRPMNLAGTQATHTVRVTHRDGGGVDLTGWAPAPVTRAVPESLWGAPLTDAQGRFTQLPQQAGQRHRRRRARRGDVHLPRRPRSARVRGRSRGGAGLRAGLGAGPARRGPAVAADHRRGAVGRRAARRGRRPLAVIEQVAGPAASAARAPVLAALAAEAGGAPLYAGPTAACPGWPGWPATPSPPSRSLWGRRHTATVQFRPRRAAGQRRRLRDRGDADRQRHRPGHPARAAADHLQRAARSRWTRPSDPVLAAAVRHRPVWGHARRGAAGRARACRGSGRCRPRLPVAGAAGLRRRRAAGRRPGHARRDGRRGRVPGHHGRGRPEAHAGGRRRASSGVPLHPGARRACSPLSPRGPASCRGWPTCAGRSRPPARPRSWAWCWPAGSRRCPPRAPRRGRRRRAPGVGRGAHPVADRRPGVHRQRHRGRHPGARQRGHAVAGQLDIRRGARPGRVVPGADAQPARRRVRPRRPSTPRTVSRCGCRCRPATGPARRTPGRPR